MVPEVLALVLYIRISDIYISNQNHFRSFHCISLSFLSLKNTLYYGTDIFKNNPIQKLYSNVTNSNQFYTVYSHEHFYLKFIAVYFVVYTLYDLKSCYKSKRFDLFIHHIVCLMWSTVNCMHGVLGYVSFNILSEGVTFAYIIPTFKNQLLYRLLFTYFVRFPVWILCMYNNYYYYYGGNITVIDLFNIICVSTIVFMDCFWSKQNYNKLKGIWDEERNKK